jgi:rod shape-determining protein MreD
MIKNIAKITLLFFIATVLHWFCAGLGMPFGIRVNVMFVFTACVCLFLPPAYGYSAAFISGLFLDFFGANTFGIYAVAFNICASLTYLAARNMDFANIVTQAFMIFLLSIAGELVYGVLGIAFFKPPEMRGVLGILLGAACNAVLAPAVYYSFKMLRVGAAER